MRINVMLAAALLAVVCFVSAAQSAEAEKTIRVAVVTGGHAFDRKAFFDMFDAIPGIEHTHIRLQDNSEVFEDIEDWPYDVLLLYNMSDGISEKRQANFKTLLERGVGLVVLHHAIANYPDWPGYREIIGAAYFRKETEIDGVTHPKSEYTHDVDVSIKVADDTHPVTAGLTDFSLNDEVYRKWILDPGNRVLLTTDHPESDPALCWVRNYAVSRVVCIQPGHGPGSFADTSFRRLVSQAIFWTAGKDNNAGH